ncbi:hypothetical protein [Kitasatospora cineracea]|uniref:hypothetical protein n=1 Tax=Kitasatospora cineracea TaxID=88074 RepID=UPI0037A559F2
MPHCTTRDGVEISYSANRPGNKVTEGNQDAFWYTAMAATIEGGSHGIALVPGDKERFNQDLIEFLES